MTAYPSLVYPLGKKAAGARPTAAGLHVTSGLAGNVALDFMTAPGAFVVAPEACTVFRWSGRDPELGVVNGSVFGWSVYLQTRSGVIYFMTHLSTRFGEPGDRLRPGDRVGLVGHWPGDRGRSHLHAGITHPKGIAKARARILEVAAAPKVVANVGRDERPF